jgi:hypothetical protein
LSLPPLPVDVLEPVLFTPPLFPPALLDGTAAAPPPLGTEFEKVRVALSQLSVVLPPPMAVAVENTFLTKLPKLLPVFTFS